eukprot:UC4_evm2s543
MRNNKKETKGTTASLITNKDEEKNNNKKSPRESTNSNIINEDANILDLDNAKNELLTKLDSVRMKSDKLRETLLRTLENTISATEEINKGKNATEGISLLDAKNQLLVSYIIHLLYIAKMRVEGQSISNHPCIDNLIEMRVMLERIGPLDKKIRYQIDRLVEAASSSFNASSLLSSQEDNDAVLYGPRPTNLMKKDGGLSSGGIESAEGSMSIMRDSSKYLAPRMTAEQFDEEETTLARLQKRKEKERQRVLDSAMMQDLVDEFSSGPKTIHQKTNKEDIERQEYEENNFVRLPKPSRKNSAGKKRGRHEDGIHTLSSVTDFSGSSGLIALGGGKGKSGGKKAGRLSLNKKRKRPMTDGCSIFLSTNKSQQASAKTLAKFLEDKLTCSVYISNSATATPESTRTAMKACLVFVPLCDSFWCKDTNNRAELNEAIRSNLINDRPAILPVAFPSIDWNSEPVELLNNITKMVLHEHAQFNWELAATELADTLDHLVAGLTKVEALRIATTAPYLKAKYPALIRGPVSSGDGLTQVPGICTISGTKNDSMWFLGRTSISQPRGAADAQKHYEAGLKEVELSMNDILPVSVKVDGSGIDVKYYSSRGVINTVPNLSCGISDIMYPAQPLIPRNGKSTVCCFTWRKSGSKTYEAHYYFTSEATSQRFLIDFKRGKESAVEEEKKWNHGFITTDNAAAILKKAGGKEGMFLVRSSRTSATGYTISYCLKNGGVNHVKIISRNNDHSSFCFNDTSKDVSFNTVPELLSARVPGSIKAKGVPNFFMLAQQIMPE